MTKTPTRDLAFLSSVKLEVISADYARQLAGVGDVRKVLLTMDRTYITRVGISPTEYAMF